MLQVPFDAAFWTLIIFVPICMGVFIYIGYKKKDYFRWIVLGITTVLVLFVPTCAGVCYLIEPRYTHEGKVGRSSEWGAELSKHRCRWVNIPSNATDIIYLKNPVRGYFSCIVESNNFINWCESYRMTMQNRSGVNYFYKDLFSAFCERGVSDRDDCVIYESKMAPNGRQMRTVYYPSAKLMYYEENYW